MFYPINHMSVYSTHPLQCNSSGLIHSVYRRTVNIRVNGQLLALQSKGSPLSPISLITDLSQEVLSDLAFAPGQKVVISPGKITLMTSSSPHIFSWKSSTIHDLELRTHLKKEQVKELLLKIKKVVSNSSTGGFELLFHSPETSDLSPVLCAAKKHIDDCTSSLSNQNYCRAADALTGLIGLGTGLTPSGDDFLCGLLAGLRLPAQTSGLLSCLSEKISVHLEDTNDISAAFLSCALNGQYSMAVNSLCRLPDTKTILSSFLEIGHSSGIDTLCGVLYALETLS